MLAIAAFVASLFAFGISVWARLQAERAASAAERSADASERSAGAAEATYGDSTSCRMIANVESVRGGKNRPRLFVSGKGHPHAISYTLIAEYQGGKENTFEGQRTLMPPNGDSTLEEIPPGNCVSIRGIITYRDSADRKWCARRAKDGEWSWRPDEEE